MNPLGTDMISQPEPEIKDKELEILEQIYTNREKVRQRDLAVLVGLALGMTNAILKRLAQKGFISIRKINNRNIRYVVSAKGVDAIMQRSYRFFKRTIKNVVYYREAIEQLVLHIKKEGYDTVILIGKSDLEFIVEHSCRRYGVHYETTKDAPGDNIYTIYSEHYIADDETKEENKGKPVEFLQNVLL